MPLHEYRCTKCGHVMEVLEKTNAGGRRTCVKCGSHRMKKLISSFAVGASARRPDGSCPTGTCPL